MLMAEAGQLMPGTREHRPGWCGVERLEDGEFGFRARFDVVDSTQQRAPGVDQILYCLSREKCGEACGRADRGVLGRGE
ncbi:hypothetical protein [Mycobacterium sp.]|uniref:hypothetical protein n=1 Tax=Mycobacterium sp. TaxID=1785 RepID=UPI0031E46587